VYAKVDYSGNVFGFGNDSFVGDQPVSKAALDRGKKVYITYCMTCHQADGRGVPNFNPPLTKTNWVKGDKKVLIGVILNGLEEEIEIEGETFANPMPSHAHLTDQNVSDVLTYIRNSFGNKYSPISVAEVAQVRKSSKK
jgi:mono/diheme cytochrome c family protein